MTETPDQPPGTPSQCGAPRFGSTRCACAGPAVAAHDADHPERAHRDDHHSGGAHHHGISADADRRYLLLAMGLLLAFMVGEVAVAFASGSLALLSDAGHMLSDVGAIAGALWAISLAARPAAGRMTFGWKRAEILVAGANGTTLLVIAAIVGWEAVARLLNPPPVAGLPVLVVALTGVVVNLAATWALARADRSRLNIEGAYQHILTDLYAFLGTAIAGIVIMVTGWVAADPIASLVVVALMARSGWTLTREAGRVLLEAAPTDLDLSAVRDHLKSLDHVQDVHELHAWTVTSGMSALSAHVVLDDECFTTAHAPAILDGLHRCLNDHFAISHATLQLEPASHVAHESPCAVS